MRRVRGVLFIDYVKMLRSLGAQSINGLPSEDLVLLSARLDPMGWYPMESFERFGLLILDQMVGAETDSIRLWGRAMISRMLERFPELQNGDGPTGAIERMKRLLNELFDFPGVVVEKVDATGASVRVDYGMSARAQDAATWQTMGFFEELLTLNGAGSALGVRTAAGFTLGWEERGQPEPERLARPRVLVVDDERLVVLGISRLLEADAAVVSVMSGEDALKKLESEEFDAVLSDYSMPSMTGLELLAIIAARWPKVRRVLHSGNPPSDVDLLVSSGQVHEVLQKPAPYDELLRAVASRKR